MREGREGRLLQPLTRLEGALHFRPSCPLFRASACRGSPAPREHTLVPPPQEAGLGKPTAGASVLMEPPDHRWSPRSAQEGQPRLTQAPSRGQSPREGQAPSSALAAKPAPRDPHHRHCIGPPEPPVLGAPSVGQAHRSEPCNTHDTSKEERRVWGDHTDSREP